MSAHVVAEPAERPVSATRTQINNLKARTTMNEQQHHLSRTLGQRQIRLLGVGATIGVGLFLGSASAIRLAGPAILLAYLIGGAAIFLIMRALGEMAVHHPVAGSFSRYAQDYIGPLTGYLTGWNYWFQWIVTCIAELTAIGIYMDLWFPGVPHWIWALAALSMMGALNLLAVKVFGEIEFWFALIKVAAIVLMIASGAGMIVFGLGNGGHAVGLSNLWSHGGFFPHGAEGVLMSLQMVMYAYLGVEMLGLTAGEATRPDRSIPQVINAVFWRILVFYVGALFIILALYPWNELGTHGSPFVLTFERLGIKSAAGLINFVVLTAALSSCNGGMFSTGRMLYNLALQGQAPRAFARTTASGVPRLAILVSGAALLCGVLLNYLVPEQAFLWVTSISTFCVIWTWVVILVAQMRFRRHLSPAQQAELAFRMPFAPYSSWFALAFLALVVGLMAYSPETRVALLVGPVWLLGLTALYYGLRLTPARVAGAVPKR